MRLLHTAALLGFALCHGCILGDINHDGIVTIAVLGDSNAAQNWGTTTRWPTLVANTPCAIKGVPVAIVNYAVGGASAWADAPDGFYGIVNGRSQLAEALQNNADAILIALGTNDMQVWRQTPDQVVASLQALCRATHSRWCRVATLPPYTFRDLDVEPYNLAIRAAFPDAFDFTTDITTDDGVHLDPASQDIAAARVLQILHCD